MSARKKIISSYLKLILDKHSQKIFEPEESLADFYTVISGIMFEQQGFLAQAFLFYQSSKHPFATYSLGHFYENGLGGTKKRADKAKACYTKVKEEIPEANLALNKESLAQEPKDVSEADEKETPAGLILPDAARKLEIEQTIEKLIAFHSQKLNSLEFHQLLVGMIYEKYGFPVQAYLIYRNTKQLPQSLYNMAYLLEHGLGLISPDAEKAAKYYNKAKESGFIKAGSVQDTIVLESSNVRPALTEKKSVVVTSAQTTEPLTTSSAEKSGEVLLFSRKAPIAKVLQEDELIKLGEEFHRLRRQPNMTKKDIFPSYVGMLKIFEERSKQNDGKTVKSVDTILKSSREIIQLDKKYPFSDYAGDLSQAERLELQFYLFKAHYYLSKHAIEPSHRSGHLKQSLIEAQVYCELSGDVSTKEALFVKNYYTKQRCLEEFKRMAHHREFSQTMISVVALALARIHRNSNDKLFFDVISDKYKFCPIQSIKLALDLMQSALTMANDEKSRKLVIRDIDFMKDKYPDEIKTIQENNPDIVDTSRKATNYTKEQWENKLCELFDAYFVTIDELFAKDRTCEVIPKLMKEISAYFKREAVMRNAVKDLDSVAKEIEKRVLLTPSTTPARSLGKKIVGLG